ncbi:MAG: lytic transglycosylase domain-containing protein, partial [Candidatus Acidiferrales bacterium]
AAGLDPQIALAQAYAESSYNPNALNPKSGAAGLFQFEPATAAQYGITNPLDATQSINGRNTYYSSLLNQFGGDEVAALAAYDWGPSNVKSAQARWGADWLGHAPSETQNYVSGILGSVSSAPPPTVSADYTDSADSGFATPDTLSPTPSPSGLVLAGAGVLGIFLLWGFIDWD